MLKCANGFAACRGMGSNMIVTAFSCYAEKVFLFPIQYSNTNTGG